jgi:hypothetical protein
VQRLAELKTLQSAATVAAEKQCASFALSKPIADCTINSVCTQKNQKFLALETNYKALAENEVGARYFLHDLAGAQLLTSCVARSGLPS